MAIALDQSLGSVGDAGGDSTIVFTTSAAVAANGFIVLGIGAWADVGTVASVSGGGLTWTVDRSTNITHFTTPSIASAPAPSGLASSTAITVTFSATPASQHVCGASFTGVDLSTPQDVVGTTQSVTGAAGWSTGNLTVAAGSLIVGINFNEGNLTSTATSPATELYDFNASGTERLTMAYRIESSAGTVAVAGTLSSTSNHAGVGVAYKAGAATGQQLRPDADNADGGWATTPLWSKIDEVSPDGTVITDTAA